MDRNILLVEPGYKTKFPPLGLMKISSYHKALEDRVKFVKGINKGVAYEYWDRIYVTTLFTYNWKTTVETIMYYKSLAKGDLSRIYVGGIMASLEPKQLWEETGIVPKTGVLSYPNALDNDNDLIVDQMIPDYRLFEDTPYDYALVEDSYFGYSTRGCVRRCEFCGVRKLEPNFIEYQGLKPYIEKIIDTYGEKRDLVLFDNNILASKKFETVINDILDLGFHKEAKFGLIEGKPKRSRRVDFNQGTDARLLTKKKAKLLGQIAINPLRIAFDSIKYEKTYTKAVLLAAENGILNLSNYVLYNHHDTPGEFWQRLKINIDLNKKYDLKIYSFPMKFIPLNAKDRSFIDEENWNWLFVRNVQRILNVLKGSVMTSEEFFFRAFGDNEKKFLEILHMPERILMYRTHTPQKEEKEWVKKFRALTENHKKELIEILTQNRTRATLLKAHDSLNRGKLKNILEYYLPPKTETPLFSKTKGN